MNFFGRRAEPKPVPVAAPSTQSSGGGVNATISKLKGTIETLGKRQQLLENKVKAEHKKALEFKRKGNKKAALLCLKKKKMYEKEIEKIINSSFNIEQQVINLESSQSNVDIINTQREFKTTMERVSKQVNVDKVADLQDDIQEQMAQQEEVQEILTQGMGSNLDDDELEDELAELMNEDEEEEIDLGDLSLDAQPAQIDVNKNFELPTVPSTIPEEKTTVDEDEAALRELEAEMAM